MKSCNLQKRRRNSRTAALAPALMSGCLAVGAIPATPALAQSAHGIEQLRNELRALKEAQQQATQRIQAVEDAIVLMGGEPVTTPVQSDTASSVQPVSAIAAGSGDSRLDLSGDLRVRYEANQGDRDGRNRHRGAIRARLRGTYAVNDVLMAGAQLSTGDANDPNTADITLDSFDDDLTVSLDQLYLQAKLGSLTLTGGKIPQPFRRTDLVWDGDVSPQGLSAGYLVQPSGSTTIKANALYFKIDEASTVADTRMMGGQIEFAANAGDLTVTLAAGYYDYLLRTLDGADAGDYRSNLRRLDGSYLSDFDLLDVIGSVTFKGIGEHWLVTLTGDYVHNFGAAVDADTGFSGDIAIGRTLRPGDWKFGYGYAQAEVDAVFAAFSHDNLGIATNYRLHTLSIDHVPMPHTGLNLTWYHYRPLDDVYAGANAPGDWLDRIRLNLMVDF